jgi:hypothetical protein
MPLFGGKREAENEKLRAELARISALPLPALAAEVMRKGFGAGGPADGCFAEPGAIAGAFNPAEGSFGIDNQALLDMGEVVVEGLQVLEHACLIRMTVEGSGGGVYHTYYGATRFGRAALAQNAVEQVLAGGSLERDPAG